LAIAEHIANKFLRWIWVKSLHLRTKVAYKKKALQS